MLGLALNTSFVSVIEKDLFDISYSGDKLSWGFPLVVIGNRCYPSGLSGPSNYGPVIHHFCLDVILPIISLSGCVEMNS